LSGIRTHEPSVRASEDNSCHRPRGYCDRQSRGLRENTFIVICASQEQLVSARILLFLPTNYHYTNIPVLSSIIMGADIVGKIRFKCKRAQSHPIAGIQKILENDYLVRRYLSLADISNERTVSVVRIKSKPNSLLD
jgi:hypothetical protein